MTAPVSVVIPTLDAASSIGPCLGALGKAALDGVIHEVIVADGGSSDAIGQIAEAVGARLISAPPGRGKQLAAGAREAGGDWLLFLHADTVLMPGWSAAVLAHIQTRPCKAGYFTLHFDRPGLMAGAVAA
jgi:glycosyltransferase involved in cell wall biosynthesis